MNRSYKGIALVCGLAVSGFGAACAEDSAMDDQMASKVRKTAIAIGNAFVCTETEARNAFREETIQLFDLIVQDEGSDMGFVYAASVGYGSAQAKSGLDCSALLEQWQGIREDFRLQVMK